MRTKAHRGCAARALVPTLAIIATIYAPASASAQLKEDEAIVFEVGDGASASGAVTKIPRTVRELDPEAFRKELWSDGIILQEPRSPTTQRRIKGEEEARYERTQRVLDQADELPFADIVHVLVELPKIPFPQLKQLRHAEPHIRLEALQEREAVIRLAQESFVEHAIRNGAESTRSLRLGNHVRLSVPAGRLVEVLNHPDVRGVYHDSHVPLADNDGYIGSQIRQDTYLQRFLDAGIDGESGGRVNAPQYGYNDIKIAVVEAWDLLRDTDGDGIPESYPNSINDTHPGWNDCSYCGSRLKVNQACLGGCSPASSSSDASHATAVTWTLGGDLTDDQHEPFFQDERTGVVPEASLMYFRARFFSDFVEAFVLAAFYGADIINLSVSFPPLCYLDQSCSPEDLCDISQDYGALNFYIRLVTDIGVLVVTGTGNTNNDTDPDTDDDLYRYPDLAECNTPYPAFRPEVISVGGVGDVPSEENNYDPLWPYAFEPLGDYSSRGYVQVGVGGWYANYQPTVLVPVPSVAAPGVIQWYFAEDDKYSYSSSHPIFGEPLQGTSFSSPVVAGAAGLFRQAMGLNDARMLKALVLLMGNGDDAPSKTADTAVGVSELYGTGRLMGHRFAGLEAPASGVYFQQHVENGQNITMTWPPHQLPQQVTQYKWASYIDAPDLSQVPWVVVSIYDSCNNSYVASDSYFGWQKYISLEGAVLDGSCLEVRTFGLSVPAGGVDVYHVGYYHSGDPTEH